MSKLHNFTAPELASMMGDHSAINQATGRGKRPCGSALAGRVPEAPANPLHTASRDWLGLMVAALVIIVPVLLYTVMA